MRRSMAVGAAVGLVLLVGSAWAAGDLKSGPQVGASVGAFEPDNVTGPSAGKKRCLV